MNLTRLLALPVLFYLLYAYFVLLNCLDALSTWLIVRPARWRREANPLARRIFQRLGIGRGVIVAELLWFALYTPLLMAVALVSLWLPFLLLLLGIAAFTGIGVNNLGVLRSLRRRAKQDKS